MATINTELFVNQRKKLGMSQVALCRGICTQSTLSKFENKAQVPSVAILTQLCDRLGLSLNQVYPEKAQLAQEQQLLIQLVQELTRDDLRAAVSLVNRGRTLTWQSADHQATFLGLEVLTMATTNQSWTATLTVATRILEVVDQQRSTIATNLAFLALAMMISRHHDQQGMSLYMELLRQRMVRYQQPEQLSDLSAIDYGELLLLMLGYAALASQAGDYSLSDQWLHRLSIAANQRNLSACLPRLKLLAAKNMIRQDGGPQWQVTNLLNDAVAFARLHNNQTVIVQGSALLQQQVKKNH
ncbi:MAG TPA: helix-turn-helix domain-containing protein [Candidatus Limosilactobacillus merdipullorum]|uniref:Helix-turn-helix domain-containing protein n=1 Tax=Candidatus Limosilactobacillus merdipullorum TaxID=2838653 RepID=A0A9D1QNR5_9LACO|nr:helix-turn-helix domain-containing protein [Candidatus Limosilactobacillus merdipullorum]